MLTLFFHPWTAWPEYKPVIVEAKNLVIPDHQIKPEAARFLCGRFIAVEEPHFMGDYALMRNKTVKSWQNAILWAIGAIEHSGAVTIQKELENIFGKPVTEVDAPPMEPVKITYRHTELW
jgi:hypothetical protein